jgi:PncC family amidohydrolase
MAEEKEVRVGKSLVGRGWRLAVAESCTGGLIGHRLTNVPGSSVYFAGGVIAYSNTAKQALLGVSAGTLEKFGAVSRECALEMARGARTALQAEVGLSVTGIAGPGGGSLEKPVGTVWIGLSTPEGESAWHFNFDGDRLAIKTQAAEKALTLLIDHLAKGASRRQPRRASSLDETEVTTRYDDQGRPVPSTFNWKGQALRVDSLGRRWEDEEGQHILALVPGGRVFELLLGPDGRRWYVNPVGQDFSIA